MAVGQFTVPRSPTTLLAARYARPTGIITTVTIARWKLVNGGMPLSVTCRIA
jgi:hypothetical protein